MLMVDLDCLVWEVCIVFYFFILLFIVYCLLFIVYCLLSIVYCLLSNCLLSIVYCLLSIVYCLLSIVCPFPSSASPPSSLRSSLNYCLIFYFSFFNFYLSGTIRVGELVPGAPPIRHALKINLYHPFRFISFPFFFLFCCLLF